jgi:hypothetical protein
VGQSQPLCEDTGTLSVIPLTVPNLPGINGDTLVAVDTYLRTRGFDNGKTHILIFYQDVEQVGSRIFNIAEHGFTRVLYRNNGRDISGLTINRLKWNWNTCNYDPDGVGVSFSVAKVFSDPATMFGLIVHELSHQSGTEDAPSSQYLSASYWESAGRNAYLGTCSNQECWDLWSIINGN